MPQPGILEMILTFLKVDEEQKQHIIDLAQQAREAATATRATARAAARAEHSG
jgi:hypothetical protein